VKALMRAIMTMVLFIGVFPSTKDGTLISSIASTRLVNVLKSDTGGIGAGCNNGGRLKITTRILRITAAASAWNSPRLLSFI